MIVQLLLELAEAADLRGKVDALFSGKHINSTEASRALWRPVSGQCGCCAQVAGS